MATSESPPPARTTARSTAQSSLWSDVDAELSWTLKPDEKPCTPIFHEKPLFFGSLLDSSLRSSRKMSHVSCRSRNSSNFSGSSSRNSTASTSSSRSSSLLGAGRNTSEEVEVGLSDQHFDLEAGAAPAHHCKGETKTRRRTTTSSQDEREERNKAFSTHSISSGPIAASLLRTNWRTCVLNGDKAGTVTVPDVNASASYFFGGDEDACLFLGDKAGARTRRTSTRKLTGGGMDPHHGLFLLNGIYDERDGVAVWSEDYPNLRGAKVYVRVQARELDLEEKEVADHHVPAATNGKENARTIFNKVIDSAYEGACDLAQATKKRFLKTRRKLELSENISSSRKRPHHGGGQVSPRRTRRRITSRRRVRAFQGKYVCLPGRGSGTLCLVEEGRHLVAEDIDIDTRGAIKATSSTNFALEEHTTKSKRKTSCSSIENIGRSTVTSARCSSTSGGLSRGITSNSPESILLSSFGQDDEHKNIESSSSRTSSSSNSSANYDFKLVEIDTLVRAALQRARLARPSAGKRSRFSRNQSLALKTFEDCSFDRRLSS
ncbi:unnamed protein product [Amoebophrya sp. A25]|nr:unnamed protein product [Amoebophrya sp. A25]|eukprot:GSA25T00018329001.1